MNKLWQDNFAFNLVYNKNAPERILESQYAYFIQRFIKSYKKNIIYTRVSQSWCS